MQQIGGKNRHISRNTGRRELYFVEKKFVAREKLSKKARRELDNQSRVTWGSIDPRAKKIESKKVYNRKRFPKAGQGDGGSAFVA